MISVQEALSRITSQARSLGNETISIEDALGRVLTQNLTTDLIFPPSIKEGYPADYIQGIELPALSHRFTRNLLAASILNVPIKHLSSVSIPARDVQAEELMQEKPMAFLRWPSFNFKKKAASPEKNKWINDSCQSILAMAGHYHIKVEKLPEVAIISTGNEIIPAVTAALPHQIRDSNSYTISSFLRKFGIHSPTRALVPDDIEALQDKIMSLFDRDILIISGGVSKGEADYVPEVLARLGVKELFHGVKIKPGAPFWFGRTPTGGVVFAMPGNPLAVQVACRIFLESYIGACFNLQPRTPMLLPLATERIKKSKFDEFFPCRIVNTSPFSGLLPVPHNGSGDIGASLQSDGIALHAETLSRLPEGSFMPFYVW